jgi:FkbM family methyltransferase
MKLAAQLAGAGPWRTIIERSTCEIAHRYPTSRAVLSFCRYFGAVLAEREGDQFERIAVFESGGKMRCSGKSNVGLYCTGYYFAGTILDQDNLEWPVVKLLRRAIRKGDVFFDIGANIGFYSFFVGPLCGVSGSVHAFEANPILIPHLLGSLDLNKTSSNIIINDVAVGSESGKTLELYDPDMIGASSLLKLPWLNIKNAVSVPVTTIDEYKQAKNVGRVDVIKIDIEGGELEAFRGMEETLKTNSPWLIICEFASLISSDSQPVDRESADSMANQPLRIVELLAAKGYEPHYISDKDGRLAGLVDARRLRQLSQTLINVGFVRPDLKENRPDLFC